MPLHLLSKKSWNVYAPENIARVKRDQAEAQAHEEEEDRRLQEHDSARRLAILRGELPSVLPEKDAEEGNLRRPRKEHGGRDDRRKRRRLQGEDDTDRDLRLAREDMESGHRRRDGDVGREEKRRRSDAPITDRDGHINLFPVDNRVSAREHKNAEVEAERARKKRELEDQYTMRFSNAAGRDGLKQGPWYAAPGKGREREEMEFIEGKDVWGRPDPSAKDREQARQVANDPFAFMQKAQSQLKQAEKDRERWQEEEQGKLFKQAKHGEGHRRERSRERSDADRDRRRHRVRAAEGDDERRSRRREHHDYRKHSKDRSRHRSRKDRRDSVSEISDGFRLDD